MIKKQKYQKVLWLTQHSELIIQTIQDLNEFLKMPVTRWQSKEKNSLGRIVVASAQSLYTQKQRAELKQKVKHFDAIVVDEAHHAKSPEWQKIIEEFGQNAERIALTATPERLDGQKIEELFGPISFNFHFYQAVKKQVVAKPQYRLLLTNSKIEGLVTSTGEYQSKDIDRLVTSLNRNQMIAKSYKKYGRAFAKKHGLKPKAICFCINRAHALEMVKTFRAYGIKAEAILGMVTGQFYEETLKTAFGPAREKIYSDFVKGTGPEVLCTVNVISEGKNIVDLTSVILCRPTRSKTLYEQQLGRGCRWIENKKSKFLVLDYVDLVGSNFYPVNYYKLQKKLSNSIPKFNLEYYKGRDPLIINQVLKQITLDKNQPDYWTKEQIINTVTAFIEKNGKIRQKDLVPSKTGLPARGTIERFWSSTSDCFKECGAIPFERQNEKRWSKQEVINCLQAFSKTNGGIRITDLGQKNQLPSQKTIYRYWKKWSACKKELGLLNTFKSWNKQKIAQCLLTWKKQKGRYPFRSECDRFKDLPAHQTIHKHFGGHTQARAYCENFK